MTGDAQHIKATDYTPAQIMGAISAALRANDMRAVVDLIGLLAIVDPHAAEDILNGIRLGRELR